MALRICRYFSSNYCNSSFWILKTIAKGKGRLVIAIVGRAITIVREIKERSKEILPKIKQRRLREINLQGAIVKGPILLLQYWKN